MAPPAHSSGPPRPYTIATRDGLDLVAESRHPPGEPRRRVLMVHGFGEHHGRYGALADELEDAGHEVHRFDLRGHGESEGRRGHVDAFAEYRRDLVRVADRVVPEEVGPLDLMAHSLGGLIALDTVIHAPRRFASLALSDPFLAPTTPLPAWARPVAKLAARFFPERTFAAGIDPQGLSRDPEVARAYLADPMRVDRVSGRWLLEVLEAQERVRERAGEIEAPVLMMLGGDDPVASVARSREVYSRLGTAEKRLVVYDGFRHELFNEIGRERVVEELLAWLARLEAGEPGKTA